MDTSMTEDNSNVFAFPDSSPQSLKKASCPKTPVETPNEMDYDTLLDDYKPSPYILNDSEDEYITEDELLLPDPAPSGRSSISSFPASVVHHDIVPSHTFDGLLTPSRSRTGTPISYSQDHKPPPPIPSREYLAGFRNPSSVRALQMRDELSDSEDLTPNHRRRGSRMSYVSYRSGSAHSTPGKRTSRSLQGSPVKNTSKLRKEFPLVLLHCSLLLSTISPKAGSVNEELLEAIIPEPYKKRWKLLQEKVMRNSEVRERGVLIPHPKEDYDMLEEKLLESLELEQPVISNGHYVGRSESRASTADSGFGSEENGSRGDTTDEEEELKCADCGGHLCRDKRWEVKVYAANGLMKAGAWSAAWSEMEKVDVQVSVALPEDVRQEIEARLDAVIAQEQELQREENLLRDTVPDNDRTREIYGGNSTQRRQAEIDGFDDTVLPTPESEVLEPPKLDKNDPQLNQHRVPPKVDLQDALKKYVKLLLQDQRNIAIIFLSILLMFYVGSGSSAATKSITTTMANKSTTETLHETQIEYLTSTVFSTSTSTALEISMSTQTTDTSRSLPKFATDLIATPSAASFVGAVGSLATSAGSAAVESIYSAESMLESLAAKKSQISTTQETPFEEATPTVSTKSIISSEIPELDLNLVTPVRDEL